MGLTDSLKKFYHNFTDNIKLLFEKISEGFKNANEKREHIVENKNFKQLSDGLQNLNTGLVGDSDKHTFDIKNSQDFNRSLNGDAKFKDYSNDIPTIICPDISIGQPKKQLSRKKPVKYIEINDEDDDDYENIEHDIVYIKRKKPQQKKRIYIEEEEIEEIYDDIDNAYDDSIDFEAITGMQSQKSSHKPKKHSTQKQYDFLHGN